MKPDTIFALITGAAPCAVAVVRLSGPDAWAIAACLFSPWTEPVRPRHAIYGVFLNGDDGIALPFEEGHSFTGEQCVELSIHGSPASIHSLLDGCQAAGARQARPGEFTLRSFISGRIDLSQAEAVAETVEAETRAQLEAANVNRTGVLAQAVLTIRERTIELLASIEASVDFSEEVGEVDHSQIESVAKTLAADTASLLIQGERSHLARKGIRIAIIGLPNAGKSSLMNALLRTDRSIVTQYPGTTRDTVEESIDFGGVKAVLVDTAGIRDSDDPVERLGVERSLNAIESADQIWYIFDSAVGWTRADARVLEDLGREVVLIGSKADIQAPDRGLAVSAVTGEGLSRLSDRVAGMRPDYARYPGVNERQGAALQLALDAFQALQESAAALHPPDLLTVILSDALDALGRITGETASPEMLEEIFSRFCIGK